jgi:hypothetical protein
MTPSKLKQAAQKPLTESAIKDLIAAVTEFYEAVDPILTVEGKLQLPVPPKPPRLFQFAKWLPFMKALDDYIAKWVAVGNAVITLINRVVKIMS